MSYTPVVSLLNEPLAKSGYTPVVPLSHALLAAPTGKQFVTVSGLPWPQDAYSILDGADPAAQHWDVIEADTQTAPSAFALTMFADGTFMLSAADDGTIQTFAYRLWRVSSHSWAGPQTVTILPLGTISRPVITLLEGEWLPSDGYDLAAMLNEAEPDDETYIYAATATTTRLTLGAVNLPLDGTRALKFRAWAPTSNGGLIVRLYQGETLIATRTYATLPDEAQTQTINLTTEEAEELTDGAALEIELESTA